MNMPKISVVVGVLLIAQGIGFYAATATTSLTALIPAAIGLPILVLGIVAFNPSVRRHAMHAAVILGMLGLLAATGRIATAGLSLSPAGASLSIMVLLCGGYIALCIKSFIDARRRQREAETTA